jgi:hypothetical protein
MRLPPLHLCSPFSQCQSFTMHVISCMHTQCGIRSTWCPGCWSELFSCITFGTRASCPTNISNAALRYSLSYCLSLVIPDVQVLRKPNSPLLALFDPVISISSMLTAPEYTISLLHHCSSLLRVSLALLVTPHTIPLPSQTFSPSPLFDLIFSILSTTPSSLAHQPCLSNIFASMIPPFLPALHIDAIAFFTGASHLPARFSFSKQQTSNIVRYCQSLGSFGVALCIVHNAMQQVLRDQT